MTNQRTFSDTELQKAREDLKSDEVFKFYQDHIAEIIRSVEPHQIVVTPGYSPRIKYMGHIEHFIGYLFSQRARYLMLSYPELIKLEEVATAPQDKSGFIDIGITPPDVNCDYLVITNDGDRIIAMYYGKNDWQNKETGNSIEVKLYQALPENPHSSHEKA